MFIFGSKQLDDLLVDAARGSRPNRGNRPNRVDLDNLDDFDPQRSPTPVPVMRGWPPWMWLLLTLLHMTRRADAAIRAYERRDPGAGWMGRLAKILYGRTFRQSVLTEERYAMEELNREVQVCWSEVEPGCQGGDEIEQLLGELSGARPTPDSLVNDVLGRLPRSSRLYPQFSGALARLRALSVTPAELSQGLIEFGAHLRSTITMPCGPRPGGCPILAVLGATPQAHPRMTKPPETPLRDAWNEIGLVVTPPPGPAAAPAIGRPRRPPTPEALVYANLLNAFPTDSACRRLVARLRTGDEPDMYRSVYGQRGYIMGPCPPPAHEPDELGRAEKRVGQWEETARLNARLDATDNDLSHLELPQLDRQPGALEAARGLLGQWIDGTMPRPAAWDPDDPAHCVVQCALITFRLQDVVRQVRGRF